MSLPQFTGSQEKNAALTGSMYRNKKLREMVGWIEKYKEKRIKQEDSRNRKNEGRGMPSWKKHCWWWDGYINMVKRTKWIEKVEEKFWKWIEIDEEEMIDILKENKKNEKKEMEEPWKRRNKRTEEGNKENKIEA